MNNYYYQVIMHVRVELKIQYPAKRACNVLRGARFQSLVSTVYDLTIDIIPYGMI